MCGKTENTERRDWNLSMEQVVDATGSGDAYMAGLFIGYLHGYSPADCCRLGSVLSYFVLLGRRVLYKCANRTGIITEI